MPAQPPDQESCVFCRIVAGAAPASRVYEDDRALVLMAINPVTPGHAMVIPKAHAPFLADLDDDLAQHLFAVTRRVAAALRRSGLRCEGVNLFLADGEAAFQEIFHFHLHVFPRFRGDGFRLDANWSNRPPRE